MKHLEYIGAWLGRLRKYVSAVFVAMLVASFVLWYLAKLNYTYTTEHTLTVEVDGERVNVCCVIEGTGTNLLGYRLSRDRLLHVPLSELKYRRALSEEIPDLIELDRESLRNAIATRCSDIKIVSLKDSVSMISYPKREKR